MRLFNYIGGKARMLETIKGLIPETDYYVEPFVGSGVVIQNLPKRKYEFINDYDPGMATLHRTLASEYADIVYKELLGTVVTEDVYERAKSFIAFNHAGIDIDPIEVAKAEIIVHWYSFNGKGGSYRTIDMEKFYREVFENVKAVAERYKGVNVVNKDGTEIIKAFADTEDCFIFADPPYDPEIRSAKYLYDCEMNKKDQHVDFLEAIKNIKGKAMICGYAYDNCLYDQVLFPCGWHRYRLAEVPKSCQVGPGEKTMAEEWIWVNYQLPKIAKYLINLGTERKENKID